MDASIYNSLSRYCQECQLGGGCCFQAKPPLTNNRIKILLENGIGLENIEFSKYKRIRVKSDGFCVFFENGKCNIHSIKPETCVAGPFTFDLKDSVLEIYLKKETICPMVGLLKKNCDIFERFQQIAVEKFKELLKALPKEELAEILKIEEPETELVKEIMLTDWSQCKSIQR